jgi:hypothetical protein
MGWPIQGGGKVKEKLFTQSDMDKAIADAKRETAEKCAKIYKDQCGTPFRGHVMKAIKEAASE